jgi:hypothetical protein
MELLVGLRSVMVCSLWVVSRYLRPPFVPSHQRILTLITQPLSATVKKPVSSSLQPPVARSLAPMESPPSLLSRLVPQLRPLPRVTTSDLPAYPLEARQPPHNTALTVSVMIAMPTPPATKRYSSSEDTFPPVQFGVTYLPVPRGWIMDAKPESG